MTRDPQDPPRLRHDPAGGPLREGLEQMEAIAIPDATRERLARNLGLGGTAAGGSMSLALKAGVLGAIAIAGVVLWWATRTPPIAVERVLAPHASVTPQVVEAPEPTATSSASIEIAPPTTALIAPSHLAIVPPVARVTPDEATLFRKAGAALRDGDAPTALQLVDEQAKLFPNGTFAQEREVLRIDALVALGKTDQARERARTFLAQHPESAHRARLERMLAQ